jgi:hypothetical protein
MNDNIFHKNDKTKIDNSNANNPYNGLLDIGTLLGNQSTFKVSEDNIKVFKGIIKTIRAYPVSRNPILYDMLYRVSGMVAKAVDIPVNQALSTLPNLDYTRYAKSTALDNAEALEDVKDFLTENLTFQSHSPYFETIDTIRSACLLGSSFLVLCTDNEKDDLRKPLFTNNKSAIYKEKIGNLYFKNVSLVFNNKLEIAQIKDLFDFQKYADIVDKEDKAINNSNNNIKTKLQTVSDSLFCGNNNSINNSDKDGIVYLYTGKDMIEVHKSRIIVINSTNMPSNILQQRMLGFGYSVLERVLNPILNLESASSSMTDLLQRASMLIFQDLQGSEIMQSSLSGADEAEVEKYLDKFGNVDFNKSAIYMKGTEIKLMSASFSGVQDVINCLYDSLAMNSDATVLELKGETASGLNAKGEDGQEKTASRSEYIRNYYKGIIQHVVNLVYANQVEVPEGIKGDIVKISWDSSRMETKEQELAKKQAQYATIMDMYNNGIITDRAKLIEMINAIGILPDDMTLDVDSAEGPQITDKEVNDLFDSKDNV